METGLLCFNPYPQTSKESLSKTDDRMSFRTHSTITLPLPADVWVDTCVQHSFGNGVRLTCRGRARGGRQGRGSASLLDDAMPAAPPPHRRPYLPSGAERLSVIRLCVRPGAPSAFSLIVRPAGPWACPWQRVLFAQSSVRDLDPDKGYDRCGGGAAGIPCRVRGHRDGVVYIL